MKHKITRLLTPPHGNTKTSKAIAEGYANYILHLAPAESSGRNVCPMYGNCVHVCLNESGRGQWVISKDGKMNPIHAARIAKTNWFFENRPAFLTQLDKEITSQKKASYNKGLKPVFRLNGTSDLRWENFGIIQKHSDVLFYDYTKIPNRRNLPVNYSLTFSRDETNETECMQALKKGQNVSVVFRDSLPETYLGTPVINGDLHDLRFLDPRNSIVGLIAKGKAKKDQSGFVV